MKKVLILVLSSQLPPYGRMVETSMNTWDSIELAGVETVYYFGNPMKKNNGKFIYFPYEECYANLGHKLFGAFEWALENKDFDFIARVNSSCYVNKNELLNYVQQLPAENLFAGVEVDASPKWAFGGCQFILSKDVVQKVILNKSLYNHDVMEDVGLSYLINDINIPYYKAKACSLNEKDGKWLCVGYNSDSIEFDNFEDLIPLKHHFYRVKIDRDRNIDKYLMEQLFKYLV